MEDVEKKDKEVSGGLTKRVDEQAALLGNLLARVEVLEKYHEGNVKEGWTEWAKRKYKETFSKKEGEESWKEWTKRKYNETFKK